MPVVSMPPSSSARAWKRTWWRSMCSDEGRCLHRLDDVTDHRSHQGLILTLRHDADQRLGAGFADQHATDAAEAGFALGNGLLYASSLQRLLACSQPDILQKLRHWRENPTPFPGLPIFGNQDGEHLAGGPQTGARGRRIAEGNIAGLFRP